ncbi:ribonuclease H-like domain-containing protein [Mycena vulgaris]|nr:ribonuclease H-like domain-containing protein [Mycena vulgaris]
MSGTEYDSESEDQPRKVIDVLGDFTVMDHPSNAFKLHGFNPKVQTPDGKWIPFQGILPIRPVPEPQAVAYAKAAMGEVIAQLHQDALILTGSHPPGFIFPVRLVNNISRPPLERFCIRRRFVPAISDLKTMMIYTDGACASNGLASPRGGFAFVFNYSPAGKSSGAVEQSGPGGQVYTHTSKRAELRAVIAALKFRAWWGEGWKRVVIVTDSEYVGKGATIRMRNWARDGWCTAAGRPAANHDLWETLSEVLGAYASGGCEISFWMVPRGLNTLADAAAKAAIELKGGEELTNDSTSPSSARRTTPARHLSPPAPARAYAQAADASRAGIDAHAAAAAARPDPAARASSQKGTLRRTTPSSGSCARPSERSTASLHISTGIPTGRRSAAGVRIVSDILEASQLHPPSRNPRFTSFQAMQHGVHHLRRASTSVRDEPRRSRVVSPSARAAKQARPSNPSSASDAPPQTEATAAPNGRQPRGRRI